MVTIAPELVAPRPVIEQLVGRGHSIGDPGDDGERPADEGTEPFCQEPQAPEDGDGADKRGGREERHRRIVEQRKLDPGLPLSWACSRCCSSPRWASA